MKRTAETNKARCILNNEQAITMYIENMHEINSILTINLLELDNILAKLYRKDMNVETLIFIFIVIRNYSEMKIIRAYYV